MSEAKIQKIFMSLGVDKMPLPRPNTGNATIHNLELVDGSQVTLRNVTKSTGKWTIDVIHPNINSGKRVEFKFD